MILVITSNVDSVIFATVRSLSANKDCDRVGYGDVTESTFSSGLFFDDPKPVFVDCVGAKIGDIRSIAALIGDYGATVVLYTDYKAKGLTKLPVDTKIVDLSVPGDPAGFAEWAKNWTGKYTTHRIPEDVAIEVFRRTDNVNDAVKTIMDYGVFGIIDEDQQVRDKKFSSWDFIDAIFSGDTNAILKLVTDARCSGTSVPEIVSMLTGYLVNMIVVNDPEADSSARVKNDYYHRKNFSRVGDTESFANGMKNLSLSLDYDSLSLALTRMASAMKPRR